MIQGEQFRFMNMNVLAKVWVFYARMEGDFNQDEFNYDVIKPYIDDLLPNKKTDKDISEHELQIMRLRLSATFLRYIKYVFLVEDQARQRIQLVQPTEPELSYT